MLNIQNRFVIGNKMHSSLKLDSSKVALFGTEHAGGFVLSAADKIGTFKRANLSCIISQTPFLSGGRYFSENLIHQRGILATLRAYLIAFLDVASSTMITVRPVYVKLAGTSNETSYLTMSDTDIVAYYSTHPPLVKLDESAATNNPNPPAPSYLGGWKNFSPAKGFFYLPFYNPSSIVKDISAPILFVSASRDETLFPASEIRQAHKSAFAGQILELNVSHYDVYSGRPFEVISSNMLKFLLEHFSME